MLSWSTENEKDMLTILEITLITQQSHIVNYEQL